MSDEKLDLVLKEMNEMKTEMHEMKTEMNQRFDTVDSRLKNLEDKSDAVYEQVVKNTEDITALKENQKIIGNVVNQIATIQQRQEDTINLLARRSLDQEEEIKRIK